MKKGRKIWEIEQNCGYFSQWRFFLPFVRVANIRKSLHCLSCVSNQRGAKKVLKHLFFLLFGKKKRITPSNHVIHIKNLVRAIP